MSQTSFILENGASMCGIEPNEIDLSQLTGNVINTQKVVLQPFKSQVISRMMKGPIRTPEYLKELMY